MENPIEAKVQVPPHSHVSTAKGNIQGNALYTVTFAKCLGIRKKTVEGKVTAIESATTVEKLVILDQTVQS